MTPKAQEQFIKEIAATIGGMAPKKWCTTHHNNNIAKKLFEVLKDTHTPHQISEILSESVIAEADIAYASAERYFGHIYISTIVNGGEPVYSPVGDTNFNAEFTAARNFRYGYIIILRRPEEKAASKPIFLN